MWLSPVDKLILRQARQHRKDKFTPFKFKFKIYFSGYIHTKLFLQCSVVNCATVMPSSVLIKC